MTSKKTDKQLYIDIEAVATLAMAQEGLLAPVKTLMTEKEHKETDRTKMFNGSPFPFSFILAPKGKRNEQVLKNAQKGEVIEFICEGRKIGEITVNEVFRIDPFKRVELIYGTSNKTHPGVSSTLKRLGNYGICGEYHVELPEIKDHVQKIQTAKEHLHAETVTGIVLAARPFHRAHERLIRLTMDRTDLLVIFLTKPYMDDPTMDYSIREKTLEYFINNFLASHKVIVVPLENTYIFSGISELILNGIVLKNYGCDKFIVGRNHAGLGLYYEDEHVNTIFDNFKIQGLETETVSEFVYCDMCKTIVTMNTCPHGQHHHVSYKSESILELLNNGILPPAVLMRTEVSAMILEHKFPDRFKNISKLFYDLVPTTGVVEEYTQKDVYISLMKLYQTSSLT
ncbi:MAG: sulfate adenylyltransferase [Campylobacterales bacterium]|nr:sulfate adenylyltransferase [Campylobacterales bacterium]